MRIPWKTAVMLGAACRATSAFAQLRAFGSAEGFGQYATGGRGGSVYHVTNLNDAGAGSFRDAVSVSNRIVVFDVGGYINLQSAVSVKSNITIAGQTAPGDGIGIMGREVSFNAASNDIVRHIRFRQGDFDPDNQKSGINLLNATNLDLDHVSIEFAQWNNIDAVGADQITVQHSIIANPIGQQFNAHTETVGGSFTWANNIFANAHNRSPLAKINDQFVNNVVYNFQAGYTAGNTGTPFSHDVINNYFITGPSTTTSSDDFYQIGSNQKAYAIGNILDANKDGNLNGSADNKLDSATVLAAPWSATTRTLPTLGTAAAFAYATNHAGANATGYDQVDSLVVANLNSLGTTGQMWSHQTSTGLSNSGYGVLNDGTHIVDTNNNGIADAWETAHGLLLNDATGYKKLNPLGYTMLEQYINELGDVSDARTWSAAGGTWSGNATNWASAIPGGGAPIVFDTALVRGSGTANGAVIISSTSAAAMSLSIGGNGPAGGESVTINSGARLSIYDTITVGDQNHAGLLINAGGTASAYNVVIGNTISGTTYNGTVTVNGVLQTAQVAFGGGTPGNWNAGGSFLVNGGTVRAVANLLITAPVTVGSNHAYVDTNGFDGAVTGVIGGAGSMIKVGTGTLTLSAANTYTGPTILRGDTLSVTSLTNGGAPGTLGASSSSAANLLLDGGSLQYSGTASDSTDRLFTLTSSGGSLDCASGTNTFNFSNTGPIAIASNTPVKLTLTGAGSGHNTFSPSLGDASNGAAVSVDKTGTGKWTFSGGAKTYSGVTHILQGTLETLATNALSPNSDVVIDAGATLEFHNNSNTIDALSGAGSVVNSFVSGTKTFTLGANNGGGVFTGSIGSGPTLNLVKTGSGVQTFSGSNTYSGATTINGGGLLFGGTAGIGGTGASVLVNSGGGVGFTPGVTNAAFLARLNTASTGALGLTTNDAGTSLNFTSGPLTPFANMAVGAVANTTYTGTYTPAGGLYRLGGGGATLTFMPTISGTASVQIGNVGSSGIVILSGSNTYIGDTTINAGTLQAANDDILPFGAGKGNLNLLGGTFQLFGHNQNINGLNGGGTINNNTGTRALTLGNGNAAGNFSGTFGGINLVKTGSGTQILSSTAGVTLPNLTANGGIVTVGGNSGALAPMTISSSLTVNNAAQVNLLPSASPQTHSVGALAINGSGQLDLGNHALLVNNAQTPASAIRSYLIAGYNNGAWNGTGGISSTTAATDHMLGNNTLALGYGGSRGAGSNQVLVVHTVYGDATLNGVVDLADFGKISGSFGMTAGASWEQGDFNYDGIVDLADFGKLSANYGAAVPVGGGGASGAGGGASAAVHSLTAGANKAAVTLTGASGPGVGQAELDVDTVTGNMKLIFNQVTTRGYEIKSSLSRINSDPNNLFDLTDGAQLFSATNNTGSTSNKRFGELARSDNDLAENMPSGYRTVLNGTFDLGGLEHGGTGEPFRTGGPVNNLVFTFLDSAGNIQTGSIVYLPVPEPTTLGFLGLGAAGLLGRRRRRSEKPAVPA